ncbi:hypothetical protein K438DRAFT_1848563 [Mycena galopus ATCC 62051]|nr:hypothetical protein K438DRAFT_1848563 [Mycena galopus ATCC 62051]
MAKCWLTRAHYLMPQALSVQSLLIDRVDFSVTVWHPAEAFALRGTFMADAPMDDLYLFLFSPRIQIIDGCPTVGIPATAYYWSFTPDGSEPLSGEILEDISAPQVLLQAGLVGRSWTERDYQLVRELCLEKGFNPESPDLANHLGYPLAKMHPEPLPLHANIHMPQLDAVPQLSRVCFRCREIDQLRQFSQNQH